MASPDSTTNELRQCATCLQELPATHNFFFPSFLRSTRQSIHCISCLRIKDKERYADRKVSEPERLQRRAKAQLSDKQRRRKLIRGQILNGYGGVCACCGESNLDFLTIDHVNNNGAAERRAFKMNSDKLFKKIIAEDFPATYQVLCWNCNCASAIHGICPHKRQDLVLPQ